MTEAIKVWALGGPKMPGEPLTYHVHTAGCEDAADYPEFTPLEEREVKSKEELVRSLFPVGDEDWRIWASFVRVFDCVEMMPEVVEGGNE